MYRTIDASFWTDLKVRGSLSSFARYLFLYYVTNPHTHVSGLYYLPDVMAQHETGLSAKALYINQNALLAGGFCVFDREHQLVWVRKMMRHQGKGEKNTLSAVHHISRDLHNSFLICEFLKEYPEVAKRLGNRVFTSETSVPLPIPDSPLQIPENKNPPFIPPSDSGGGQRKARGKTEAPDVLEITESLKSWASGQGFTDEDIARETPAMLDYFRGKGERKADWLATWRNWLRNSKKYSAKGKSNGTGYKTLSDRNREALERFESGKAAALSGGSDATGDNRGNLRRV